MEFRIYPTIKQRMNPYIQSTKADMKETVQYYKGNFKSGWNNGSNLAKIQRRNPLMSFLIKAASSIAKTRIRGKDISPILGCVLFSFTNPIPGFGIVGFALGRGLHKKLLNGIIKLKNALPKLRIK